MRPNLKTTGFIKYGVMPRSVYDQGLRVEPSTVRALDVLAQIHGQHAPGGPNSAWATRAHRVKSGRSRSGGWDPWPRVED